MKSSPNLPVDVGRVMLTGGVKMMVIINYLHPQGHRYSQKWNLSITQQKESTLCAKQGIYHIFEVYNLIRH